MIDATFRAIATAVALLVCAVSLPAQTSPLQGFSNHGVTLSITSRSTTDMQKVTATWGQASDGRLTADRYHITATVTNRPGEPIELEKVTLSHLFEVPLQAFFGDSVKLRVVVRASRKGIMGTDSVWGERWFKRQQTAAERAYIDSFPPANHRITLCSKYGLKVSAAEQAEFRAFNLARALTAQDSGKVQNEWEAIRLGPDSVYTPQTSPDTTFLRPGYKYGFAVLLKNRYTGKVRTEDGAKWTTSNPDVVTISPGSADCSAMIAAWEAERSS